MVVKLKSLWALYKATLMPAEKNNEPKHAQKPQNRDYTLINQIDAQQSIYLMV